MITEFEIEKFLKIKTTGRDDSNSDLTNYPYEATSYAILQQLVLSEYFSKDDIVIDYGSGKGRVDFYLSYFTKSTMIGIEYDKRLYDRSLDNLNSFSKKNRVSFVNCCASSYSINKMTKAYFFNPFSIHILKQLLSNIITYVRDNNEVLLFFYYPSDEYLSLLNTYENIIHIEDIDCMDLFKKADKREYISIYKVIK